jgi:hypothetical protein
LLAGLTTLQEHAAPNPNADACFTIGGFKRCNSQDAPSRF